MSKVEFYYFPFSGLGEQIRLLLAYGGEDWNDNQIRPVDWPELKPKTPFGKVPVMVIDGKQYAQSIAMSRYLGRKYRLAGANLEEDFQIDQSVAFLMDIYQKPNVNPGMLQRLDQIIRESNGHLALGKLTWADFVFTGIYDQLKYNLQACGLGSKYPSFDQLAKTVYSLPRVKEYAEC